MLMLQPFKQPETAAKAFVKGEVANTDEALQGARDIIAERVNENERSRQTVRRSFECTGMIRSKVVKGKEAEAGKFRDYFDWSEPLKRCTSHRLLAMRRGEAEGYLRVSISPSDDDDCISRVERGYVKAGTPAAAQVEMAIADAYKRLLKPSIETEFAGASKGKADEEAIHVFANNLKQLLLAAPLGQNASWALTLDFALAARWYASMHRATCCTTRLYFHTNHKISMQGRASNSTRWLNNTT